MSRFKTTFGKNCTAQVVSTHPIQRNLSGVLKIANYFLLSGLVGLVSIGLMMGMTPPAAFGVGIAATSLNHLLTSYSQAICTRTVKENSRGDDRSASPHDPADRRERFLQFVSHPLSL